jgi:photosystem II stability/assembly factor-like uncharacterized protein
MSSGQPTGASSAVAAKPTVNVRRAPGSVVVRVLLVVFLLGLGIAFNAPDARAHVPHDVISSVTFSPQYSSDQTVFTISRGHLLRSGNGGSSWSEAVQGIGAALLEQVAVAASDKSRMYLASDSGVLRSTDSGSSWTFSLVAGGISQVVVSPANPDVLLAAGRDSGLYRSTNGGQNWLLVAGDFGRVTALSFGPAGSWALLGTETGRIYLSLDAGSAWTVRLAIPSGAAVTALGVRRNLPANETLAGTSKGELFRSTDGGSSFVRFGTGIPQEQVMAVAVSSDYSTDHTVWLSTWTSGVYRSTNSGGTWTRTSAGLTSDPQGDEYGVPQFGTVVTAPDQAGHQVLFVGGFDGLFRSDDLGATWHEQQTLTEYLTGLAVSPDYAHDHTVVVNSYVKGAYLTTDGGSTWRWADNGIGAPLSEGNKFAPVRRLFGVAFSPDYANDGTIFSATWDRIIKTTNRGESWTQIAVPLAPGEISATRLFVIAVSPSFHSDHTVYVGTSKGAIFRTTNGGASWTLLSELGSRVRNVVISPAFPADPVVYVSTVSGIFRSNDRGLTWTKSGPSGTTPQLAMSPQYTSDGTVLAGTVSGLWVTRNSGQSWSVLAAAPLRATSRVDAVAISPTYGTDRTMLVSIRAQGLYRSTDGGTTFVAVGTALTAANHAIRDFENPASSPIQYSPNYAIDHTVYAFGGMDLMRSTDAGLTWALLSLPSGADFLKPPAIANATTPATVLEGSTGTSVVLRVPFDLSHPSTATVTVQWRTIDGAGEPFASSATGDYVARSGVLVFPPGSTRQYAEVTVKGDNLPEPNELVAISTSNPTNAKLGGFYGLGFGGITNDD